MKKIFLLMMAVPVLLRAQTATEAVSDRVCDCMQKEHSDTISTRAGLESKIADCFVQSLGSDLEKVLKECHVKKFDTEGGRIIGVEIGKKMMVRCPSYQALVLRLYGNGELGNQAKTTTPQRVADDKPVGLVEYSTGKVLKKETNGFVWITVKDASGSETRYLWLTHVSGSQLLENGQDIIGLNVKIGWRLEDVFLPEQQTYVTVRQIVSFEAI
jgi:hypothetical protein